MKRRDLLISAMAVAACRPAFAADKPWSARLLKGGFDGKVWWAGLHITLAPKWKTYWRVPGEGGIAPQIDISGENIASHETFHPMPHRYEDEAGITIGYKDEVVFPIAVAPREPAKPVKLSLKAFVGVCDVVCIPVQFDAQTGFDPSVSDAPDQAFISRWRNVVPPVASDGPVTKATAKFEDGKVKLQLDLREDARDIFVEGKPAHYFGKPGLIRGFAILPVSGANSPDELKGVTLRITLDSLVGPVEQSVTVE